MEVRDYHEAALAKSTRNNYAKYFRAWALWCERGGIDAIPAKAEDVKRYLIHRCTLGDTTQTCELRLASLRHYHRDAGLDDPTVSSDFREFMRGMRRTHGVAQEQVKGITARDLSAIRARGGDPRIAAIISVMRDAMLRRCEAAALQWCDLECAEDGSGRITVRRSKTDQEGAGTVLYISAASVSDVLRNFERQPDDDRIFGLSASYIARRIGEVCERAGLQGRYSGHSPRIGMAMDLAADGAGLPALMQAGRWKTASMPSVYLRGFEAGRNAVARFYTGGQNDQRATG